ncbi:hypothetical protein DesfrDRAFT_0185 [Solidesulfovibrio fructosivorans JJ]]|uniref:Uncharacterized protein n=1 Tax=Solidesulfovibrio fructosivorans JJ] TaxID=596151 RepID=E1JRD6_SOLFR|nr:hypothetical protein [Solidesulfovibrio fructosivorans]EFL53137.1 hypothetical protein DesfrDRAFT_0185 [Solidesulfovibrio fructosivorans JJ]]
MQPDAIALAILWIVWGLAVLAIGAALWIGRHERVVGRRIDIAPETAARFER